MLDKFSDTFKWANVELWCILGLSTKAHSYWDSSWLTGWAVEHDNHSFKWAHGICWISHEYAMRFVFDLFRSSFALGCKHLCCYEFELCRRDSHCLTFPYSFLRPIKERKPNYRSRCLYVLYLNVWNWMELQWSLLNVKFRENSEVQSTYFWNWQFSTEWNWQFSTEWRRHQNIVPQTSLHLPHFYVNLSFPRNILKCKKTLKLKQMLLHHVTAPLIWYSDFLPVISVRRK